MRSLCLSRWNSELQCAAVAYSRWHHLGFKLGLNLGGAKRKRGTCKAQATHGARGPCAPGADRRRLCGPRGARAGRVHWQVAWQAAKLPSQLLAKCRCRGARREEDDGQGPGRAGPGPCARTTPGAPGRRSNLANRACPAGRAHPAGPPPARGPTRPSVRSESAAASLRSGDSGH